MSTIFIHAPGPFTTVQDLGRDGFGPLGVSPSGAADAIALRLGNRLVGNAETAAGLEMTLVGGTFQFPEGGVVALTGSDFSARLDDAPVALWTSVRVQPGQTLHAGSTRNGARCYLCVQGGILVKPFLGSASTHVLSGLGGWQGRPLRKGDVLQVGLSSEPFVKRTVAGRVLERLAPRKVLRFTPGPQSDWFPEASHGVFGASSYRVAEQSNRVGIRLEGPPILRPSAEELITEGVSLGAIQVPPDGHPIIVFVEQQTTGGYPKIANIISADLHSVGQLRPRDEVRFARVEIKTARDLLKEQEELLASPDLETCAERRG
jgi:antagonist of KipI